MTAEAVGARPGEVSQGLARNRNFLLLTGGQFVSQMGDRLALVAFPWLVYSTTHSAVSTGVVLALFTLPYVAFGAFAGAIIDRLGKRPVMIAADFARAGLVLAVPFVAHHSLPAVYVLTFLTATATVFFLPSLMAMLPEIVNEEDLLRANSVLSASEHTTEIIGYAAAGFIVYYLSIRTSFTVDAATFLVSAVTLVLMRVPRRVREDVGGEAGPRPGLAADIRQGVSFLRHHAGARANTIIVVVAALGVGASYPLTFLLAMREYDGTRAFGFMEAALAAGFLAGSLTLAILAKRLSTGRLITWGLVGVGIGFALVGLAGSLPAVLVMFVVVGLADAAFLVSVDTYLQRIVPEAIRGRVWGVRFTLTQSAYAIGVLVAGALAAGLAVGPLFVACGALVAAPAVVALVTVGDSG